MAVIDINSVGGILPSTKPRALPPGNGQVAHNLLPVTMEFRPLQTDVAAAVSAVANPKTLYRLARKADGSFSTDMSTGWKVSELELNYVKGALNDERTERTYYTFADGSQPPRVMNVLGEDKPLGVPAPATAPTGSVVVNYSYSPEARAAELAKARDDAARIIIDGLDTVWLGMPRPGSSRPGYADRYNSGGQDELSNPDFGKVFRAFQVSAIGSSTVVSTYSLMPTAMATLAVQNTSLNGFYITASGPNYAFPWAPADSPHYVIPVPAYGRAHDLPSGWNSTTSSTSLVSKLRSIKMPGDPSRQLMSDENITKFLVYLQSVSGPNSPRIKPLIEALSYQVTSFLAVVDAGTISSMEYAVAKISELQATADLVDAEYGKVAAELPGILEQWFYANGLDSSVPPGEARILEDRFYICTYVTAWGEESAPSPVSQMAELDQNDVVTGSPPAPPPGYGITKFRYYRTNTGNAGAAFQFVDEVAFSPSDLTGATKAKVTDSKKSTELGEVCPTLIWAMPPPRLSGLVGLANGVLAGFFDNTFCPSESYIPYAFPVEYQITTEYPIMALGAFGQTAVTFHRGGVDYISGADAASMSREKNVSLLACVSRRSIANSSDAVGYASALGICVASRSGVQLLTENHFTHEDWQKLNPSTIVGGFHENTYFFMCTPTSGPQVCYALHVPSGKLTTLDVQGSAFYVDILTDRLYVANGNSIVALFAGAGHRTGLWRSKIIVMPSQAALAWLVIESDFEAPITVRWYGDGVLRSTSVVTSRAPVRLPPGRWLEHVIEVESAARWNRLVMTSSTAELQAI